MRTCGITNLTVANGIRMSADGNLIQQKRTVTRARPLVRANESSDEHGQSFMGALAFVKGHPKRVITARKAESRQLCQTTDHEEEVGRFNSQ